MEVAAIEAVALLPEEKAGMEVFQVFIAVMDRPAAIVIFIHLGIRKKNTKNMPQISSRCLHRSIGDGYL